jgi:AcrR family transcriptional regulator
MSQMQTVDAKPVKSWSRRKAARPGEILDAALKVFAAKGYAAARMEDIAQAAGVTKGTIYLYFSSKADVLKTLAQELIGNALANGSAPPPVSQGSPRERVVMILSGISTYLQSDERIVALLKIVIGESGNFPELACIWRREVIDKALGLMGQALEQGMTSGEFRKLPAEHVAKICIAPILLGMIWRSTFASLSREAFDYPAFFATHIDMLMRGLESSRINPSQGDAS